MTTFHSLQSLVALPAIAIGADMSLLDISIQLPPGKPRIVYPMGKLNPGGRISKAKFNDRAKQAKENHEALRIQIVDYLRKHKSESARQMRAKLRCGGDRFKIALDSLIKEKTVIGYQAGQFLKYRLKND